MSRRKAFFASFFVSMIVVLAGFGILYGLMGTGAKETDTPQKGVPVTRPGTEDSKTLLLCVGDEHRYFFIFKFDALQNKIGIGAISPQYEFSAGGSLADSLQKAGIMQCVLDLQEEFGIGIDYYLQCSWSQLGKITEELTEFGVEELGENLPLTVKNYLLKGAEMLDGKSLANAAAKAEAFLDNELGLAFMNETAWCTVKYNLENLSEQCGEAVKKNYSNLITNLNTEDLQKMERIMKFLAVSHLDYPREVIMKGDSRRQEKMENITR